MWDKLDDRDIVTLPIKLDNEDWDVRQRAGAMLLKLSNDTNNEQIVATLLNYLKDNSNVSSHAATALGRLVHSKSEKELFKLLEHNLSGYRIASAHALVGQDSLSSLQRNEIDRLRFEDKRPWVRLAAWEAYELWHERLKAEKESSRYFHEADSLFAIGKHRSAIGQYQSSFYRNPKIMHADSVSAARAKFQQARCAALLKRKAAALDHLKTAFEYNPALRDTLRAEMSQPENDWKILEGNWYLREVLLKKE